MGTGSSKNPVQERRQSNEKIYAENAKQLVNDYPNIDTTIGIDDLDSEKLQKSKELLPQLSACQRIHNLAHKEAHGGSSVHYSNRNRYDQFDIFDMLRREENQMKGGNNGGIQEQSQNQSQNQLQTQFQPQVTTVVQEKNVVQVHDNQTCDEALTKV